MQETVSGGCKFLSVLYCDKTVKTRLMYKCFPLDQRYYGLYQMEIEQAGTTVLIGWAQALLLA